MNLIPLREAQKLIVENLTPFRLPAEWVELDEAAGRVLAEEICAPEDIPAFHRSTVDGFAVASRDTVQAGESIPIRLRVAGRIIMGQTSDFTAGNQNCVEIPTGGILPQGADAVIMVEATEWVGEDELMIFSAVSAGDNVIRRGEDMLAGMPVLRAGIVIGAAEVGVLAACGIAKVKVYGVPILSIITTGDELVSVDTKPKEGQVRTINSHTLPVLARNFGCRIQSLHMVPDNLGVLSTELQRALIAANIVLVSGGSSVGHKDYTVQAVESLSNSKTVFHGVALKPGKPTFFGIVGETPVFGIPGHPAAAMVVFREIVSVALRTMMGMQPLPSTVQIKATLASSIKPDLAREELIPVRLIFQGNANYAADPIRGKSGLISMMSQADGLLRVPAGGKDLRKDELVTVELLGEWKGRRWNS